MRLYEFVKPKYAPVNVKSPAFKAWFGKSVVRNKDGSPKVVYHGTNKNFNYFDTRINDEIGSHFGGKSAANWIVDTDGKWEPKTGSQIFPVYIKIEHPFRLKDDYEDFTVNAIMDQLFERIFITNKLGLKKEEDVIDLVNFYRRKNLSTKFKVMKLQKFFQSKGYDGIVYRNEYEGGGDSYIVFSPTQVKSAITNTGKFNPRARTMTESRSLLFTQLKIMKPKIAQIAQKVYDKWSGKNYGSGICDTIAWQVSAYVSKRKFDLGAITLPHGRNKAGTHAYAVVFSKTESYLIDIPYWKYEESKILPRKDHPGKELYWKKIPDVTLSDADVRIVAIPRQKFMNWRDVAKSLNIVDKTHKALALLGEGKIEHDAVMYKQKYMAPLSPRIMFNYNGTLGRNLVSFKKFKNGWVPLNDEAGLYMDIFRKEMSKINEVTESKLHYNEEGSFFTHGDIKYDLNKIFKQTENLPIEIVAVKDLKWILKHCKPQSQERVNNADISVPILVTNYKGTLLVVDGLHRIAKAIEERAEALPAKFVTPKMLTKARVDF